MVIDEIFHLLINQLVNHFLLLLREPVWLYHALYRWSKPCFRKGFHSPYLDIGQTIQYEHSVIPSLPQLVFLLRGGQTHFDGGVDHGIYDLFHSRSLLFGSFVLGNGRLVNDYDLSQDLAVILDGERWHNVQVVEALSTLNQRSLSGDQANIRV